jgi:hypothetical protein
VLVEEAQLRDDGADEREEDSKIDHGIQGRSGGTACCGTTDDRHGLAYGPLARPVPLYIGSQGPRLENTQTIVQLPSL